MFLTYLTLPVLLAVRPRTGARARSFLDGKRERAFLLSVLGFADRVSWRGGIKNARVRRLAMSLGERHKGFPGMKPEYLNFVAAVIALAPLRIREALDTPVDEEDRAAYWRYMIHAMAVVGADLHAEQPAADGCRVFVEAHASPSGEGRQLFTSLNRRHPDHVRQARPLLFDRSRAAVRDLLRGVDVD